MTFEQAVAYRDTVSRDVAALSEALGAFPKLPNGLTPDKVKASPEYRMAKVAFDAMFRALREVNSALVAAYPKELKAARRAKQESRTFEQALKGDGEKLCAITGQEHGPW